MPLIHSASEEAVGKNIAIEKHAHPDMPQKQAIAIAESTKREAAKDDEAMFGAKHPMHDAPYVATCSAKDMQDAIHQMWGENEHDPENANGIVTPR